MDYSQSPSSLTSNKLSLRIKDLARNAYRASDLSPLSKGNQFSNKFAKKKESLTLSKSQTNS
jgi:hypothetical protein